MQYSFDTEVRRSNAQAMYVDSTMEVLLRPAVEDALGELATRLATTVQNSFVIPRRGSLLVLPPEQADTNNLGIHPRLTTELHMPGWDKVAWTRHDTLTNINEKYPGLLDKKLRASIFQPRRGIRESYEHYRSPFTSTAEWLFTLGEDEDILATQRPIVFMPHQRMRRITPLATAAVTAHETIHAVMSADSSEALYMLPHAQALAMLADPAEEARKRVLEERIAYGVTHVLLAQGENAPTVKEIKKKLVGLGPEAAGLRLRGMVDGSDKSLRLGEEHLGVQSAGALALTELFAKRSPVPTAREIRAYRAACLIIQQ